MSEVPKNISSWKLNKAEQAELQTRKESGECEITVKREIQTRKALANEARKKSAAAVASKCLKQAKAKASKPRAIKAEAGASAGPPAGSSDETNQSYYSAVQADIVTVLAEFGPKFEEAPPLPLAAGNAEGGVQDPYDEGKCKQAMASHGIYRASISLFSLNLLSSATPGIPLSRKRVVDMCKFYFPEGKAAFMTNRMFEVALDPADIAAKPSGLQMLSPEELAHSVVAACAFAIKTL